MKNVKIKKLRNRKEVKRNRRDVTGKCNNYKI